MLSLLLAKAQDSAAHKARMAAVGLGASIALFVGFAFLTLAAWLFLISVTTALVAALILGCTFVGIGLITLSVMSSISKSRKRARQQAAAAAPQDPGLAGLAAAFVTGMTAGAKVRS